MSNYEYNHSENADRMQRYSWDIYKNECGIYYGEIKVDGIREYKTLDYLTEEEAIGACLDWIEHNAEWIAEE